MNNNLNLSSDTMNQSMYVVKRNKEKELVSFDKVQRRILKLTGDLEPQLNGVNSYEVAQSLIVKIYDGIETWRLDELAATICADKESIHPDYGILASRFSVSNHHKNTSPSFSETIRELYNDGDGLIDNYLYEFVNKNKSKLNSVIDYKKDFEYSFFGFKTLERAYLMKLNGKIIERPQHMIFRVACSIHRDDIKEAIKCYKLMSEGYFTHATPTLFNMGTKREQASSCFLLAMDDDSIKGIYKTITDCALISKWAGGIGLSVHNVRAKNSIIKGTNGMTDGLIPMLKVFNETARYVNQGGKRKGSFAIYLEPWHADIEDFLMLRRNTGAESERARDLFYAIWIPDLFMKRVENDQMWSLMSPDESPNLHDCYGEEFESLYEKYEKEGKYREQVPARKLWNIIIDSQIETGTPYIGFKDAINRKSNQKNLGTIRSSNLCIEIVEYTSKDEIAVCNLGSIALPKFVEYTPIITQEHITIYSKNDCKFCKLAKKILDRQNLNYKEINLDDSEESAKIMDNLNKERIRELELQSKECQDESCDVGINAFKIKSVPQIYFGSERIGGYKELKKLTAPQFNFKKLEEITKMLTKNLNKVIDWNFYPVPETENSNRRHRPIGVGVQGLADVFAMMRMPFDSQEARELNKKIFAHMYIASLECSMDISRKRKKHIQEYRKLLKDESNLTSVDTDRLKELKKAHFIISEELKLPSQYAGSYSSFIGSPSHKGILQYDLWDVEPIQELKLRFEKLKDDIKKHGLRNSLCIALMPTASTSQILGNNECIEPYTSNYYKRRTLAGEFKIINKYLVKDLIELGIWSPDIKDKIILNDGSIQGISEIPKEVQDLYKTVWEISQKCLIDMSSDRGAYVCQTQSLNLFMNQPKHNSISSMHFYSWKKGSKTGIYYLRTLSSAKAQKVTISMKQINESSNTNIDNTDECLTCSA